MTSSPGICRLLIRLSLRTLQTCSSAALAAAGAATALVHGRTAIDAMRAAPADGVQAKCHDHERHAGDRRHCRRRLPVAPPGGPGRHAGRRERARGRRAPKPKPRHAARRRRSASRSRADWWRRSRSFSSARPVIRSYSAAVRGRGAAGLAPDARRSPARRPAPSTRDRGVFQSPSGTARRRTSTGRLSRRPAVRSPVRATCTQPSRWLCRSVSGSVRTRRSPPSRSVETLATPKSSTLASPRAVRRMFALLMSRWMIPAEWAASSASATWIAMSSSRSMEREPARTSDFDRFTLEQFHHDQRPSLVVARVVDACRCSCGSAPIRRASRARIAGAVPDAWRVPRGGA